jgi:hypothetical protein
MSLQVFSYSVTDGPMAHPADILAALNLVKTRAASSDKYTINMSLGDGGRYQANCDSNVSNITWAIRDLIALRVPVVASAGNSGHRFGIGWPACVSGVIKSAGSINNGVGDTLASGSNIISENLVTGRVLMAPSYSVTTSVLGGGFGAGSQTSLAAPQVAGYYAMIKSLFPGITVADIGAAMAYQPLYPTRVPLAKELNFTHNGVTIKLRRIMVP